MVRAERRYEVVLYLGKEETETLARLLYWHVFGTGASMDCINSISKALVDTGIDGALYGKLTTIGNGDVVLEDG